MEQQVLADGDILLTVGLPCEAMRVRTAEEVLQEFDRVFALAFPNWRLHMTAWAPGRRPSTPEIPT